MMGLLLRWLILTAAILLAAYLLNGIEVRDFLSAFLAAAVLGILNAFFRPLLLLLTLPLNILTLGLFTLVINALLIMLAATVVPGFAVQGFWWALLFGIVLAIVNFALSPLLKSSDAK